MIVLGAKEMSAKVNETKRKIYVCTKLSIISPNLEDYQTNEYFDVASKGLNTGEEKHIFFKKEQADSLLHNKGTIWCVYDIEVPSSECHTSKITGKITLNEKYSFSAQDIKDIFFHTTFTPNMKNAPS
jgi:hypothetical protein